MLSETQLTAKYAAILRRKGCLVFNIHGHDMQAVGWPDTFICHWRFKIWIEFKGPKTILKPLQSHILEQLEQRKAVALVGRFFDNYTLRLSNYDESKQYHIVKGETYAETAANLMIALEGIYNVLVKRERIND